MNRKDIKMEVGEMMVYDLNGYRLHAYNTKDALSDEVFIVEKDKRAFVIESPCFFNNIKELESYIKENGIQIEAVLLAYHAAGGSFLKDAKKISTKNAVEYNTKGGGKALVDNFTSAFGSSFDSSLHVADEIIEEGKNTIAGIDLNICLTSDAYDIEIPNMNVVYTHMLGHDCHSIVAGEGHADHIIHTLNDYIKKGYDFALSSHYTPEDLKDVKTKIEYLENLKKIATEAKDKEDFIEKMKESYPAYSGNNYLEMTASFFFA